MTKSPKEYQIANPVVRWMMIFSLMIVFLTFLTSWILWFLLYRDAIEKMLTDFTFNSFSMIILLFAGCSAILACWLIFLRKKTSVHNIFALLSFIFSLVLASASFLIYYKGKINHSLVIAVPWIIGIVSTIILFISSSVNLIIVPYRSNKNDISSLAVKEPIFFDSNSETVKNCNVGEKEQNSNIMKQSFHSTNYVKAIASEEVNPKTATIKIKEVSRPIKSEWTKKQIVQVWEKGEIIPGVNKDLYRKDYAGAWMFFSAFVQNSEEINFDVRSYTWTIAQHNPLILANNPNDLTNLVPMNFVNSITKGENYPRWKTKISSRGNENIIKEQIWNEEQ